MTTIQLLGNIRGNYVYIHDPSKEQVFIIELPLNEDNNEDDEVDLDPILMIKGKMSYSDFNESKGNLLPISEEDNRWLTTVLPYDYVLAKHRYHRPFFIDVSRFLQRYTSTGSNSNIEELYRAYLTCGLTGTCHFTFRKFKTFLPANFQYSFNDIEIISKKSIDDSYTQESDDDSYTQESDDVKEFDVNQFNDTKNKESTPITLFARQLIIDGVIIDNYYITYRGNINGKYIITINNGTAICGELFEPCSYEQLRIGLKKEELMSKFKLATDVVLKEYGNIAFSLLAHDKFLRIIEG